MPAFSDKKHAHLNSRIKELAELSLSWRRCPLDHDDILQLFVREQDREVLTQAAALARPMSEQKLTSILNGMTLNLRVFSSAESPFLVPTYAGPLVEGAEQTKAYEKLVRFAQGVAEVKREWAVVSAVFERLNWECTSPFQVRAMFPAIATLFGSDKAYAADVTRLGNAKAVKDLPPFSIAFRKACIAAAGTVTKGSMLPVDKVPPGNKQVGMSLTCPLPSSWGEFVLTAVI